MRPAREKSILAVLRSGPFLVLLVGCLLLGSAAIGRVWHVNRNKLLSREIGQLERRAAALREQYLVLQLRRQEQLSPQAIEERLRHFGLDLVRPAEEQFLRVIEPRWEAILSGSPEAGNVPGWERETARGRTGEEVTRR